MSYDFVIGIDPGKTGAIATLDAAHNETIFRFDKASDREIADYVWALSLSKSKAFLEKVHTMPMQGSTSSGALMERRGFIYGVLLSIGIPFEWVPPQTWYTKLGIKNGGLSYAEKKRRNKGLAEQWFPRQKLTLDMADALLIAEYGHRTEYRVR